MSDSILKVSFIGCHFASQELGSTDEHLVSLVTFDLLVDGQAHPNLTATVKQTVGSYFSDGQLEVGPPKGYKGPFSHEGFAKAVTAYYRGLVGTEGTMIRADKSSNVTIRDCRFQKPVTVEIPFDRSSPAAW